MLALAWLSILLPLWGQAQGKPKFNASEVAGRGSEWMVCDLDGDGLKDLILKDDLVLSIFYQDANHGFTREPQQTLVLDHRPSVVWAAKLGGAAGSLLVMTSDGVSEICFTNRTGPPAIRQIIGQPTIVPDTAEGTNAICLSWTVETGEDWPLVLVPAEDGLHVWQHRGEWRQAQVIADAIDARVLPSLAAPGYTNSLEFDLSVGDINADGREDLILRRCRPGRTNTYTLYLQQTNGLFDLKPALTYSDKVEPFSWLCWVDLNHDGKVDLVKSHWLNEASFVPGVPSSKVVVSTYIAGPHGGIPTEPHGVFRKNDWTLRVPVVDLDGDGLLDLVLGYSHMDSRESVIKQITAKQMVYSLKMHFFRPGIGYPPEADCQRDVVIHLDRPEGPLDWDLPQSFQRCVDLGGHFSGAAKSDLLVRDHSDAISVYFFVSRQKGFSLEPDLKFSCPEPIDEWQVTDLNRDGVSDLIVKLAKQNGFRIFISQEGGSR